MGVIVSGLVTFELDAPAGTVLDLAYMEQPLRGPIGMLGQHAGTRYIARGEHDSFEVFNSNGLRYAYILLHGAAGPVTLRSFAVRELVYPWETGAEFNCDDAELNRIYRAGIRTVQLNSHDAFWIARPASSVPGLATAWYTRWCIWLPTATGGWPGGT